jgi:arabinan endo-1,5-alpha-L-arabinosidase
MGKMFDTASTGVGNSIDEFYIETGSGRNKTKYMFWGSFHGIFGIELSSDMKTLIGDKFQIAGGDFEGSYIYERNGYVFYIGSSGTCCEGNRSTSHLTGARADNIKGPYLRKDGGGIMGEREWENVKGEGTPLLHGNTSLGWVGPGHNGEIMEDDKGRYFIIYHAIKVKHPYFKDGQTRRPLLMDEVFWDEDGWPRIEHSQPSTKPKRAPFFNPW